MLRLVKGKEHCNAKQKTVYKGELIIHVPHSSLYVPEEYRRTALISQDELEEENRFMCDMDVDKFIPLPLRDRTVVFPYSRLYCDVERFRDGTEAMDAYGMGYIYTKTSKGRIMFDPSPEHVREVNAIYDAHHDKLNKLTAAVLEKYGRCLIIDLHSFSDATVSRLFGYENCPDVCIGTECDYYDRDVIRTIECLCSIMGFSTQHNYPYSGSLVPSRHFGKKNTGIVSVMLEINKRIYA